MESQSRKKLVYVLALNYKDIIYYTLDTTWNGFVSKQKSLPYNGYGTASTVNE